MKVDQIQNRKIEISNSKHRSYKHNKQMTIR
jgi:hypothetical protein